MPNYLKPGDDVETIITRPSSTTLLAISSNDRYSSWSQRRTSPTNPFSFIIQKNQALMNGYFRRIALTEFRLNWTLPNIATAWKNNTMNISYLFSQIFTNANVTYSNSPDTNCLIITMPTTAGFVVGQTVTMANFVSPNTIFNADVTVKTVTANTSIKVQYGITIGGAPSGTYTAKVITKNASTFQIGLPDGFYGAEELGTALSQSISAGGYASGSSTFVNGIAGFTVSVTASNPASTGNYEDDQFSFTAPAGYNFWLTPTTSLDRQLIDMLAVPRMASPGVKSLYSGIPDLRATEYVDIVCSQLTNNMHQKDSTSAPIVRDMLARIYLDDDVPSQANIVTNYYNTTYASATPSASVQIGDNSVVFTVGTISLASFPIDTVVVVSGITGGVNYNGTATVIGATTTSLTLDYTPNIINGQPTSYSGATIVSTQGTLTQTSIPQTSWDDRVNGVTPFVLYRQFPYPKQIRWEHTAPIGNLRFEMFDSQGRAIADLFSSYGSSVNTFISLSSISGQVVTYTLGSNANIIPGQYVFISGITGTNVTGYNGVPTVQSVSGTTVVSVVYPTSVTLGGTNLNYDNAELSSFADWSSSFAWNTSILCSED